MQIVLLDIGAVTGLRIGDRIGAVIIVHHDIQASDGDGTFYGKGGIPTGPAAGHILVGQKPKGVVTATVDGGAGGYIFRLLLPVRHRAAKQHHDQQKQHGQLFHHKPPSFCIFPYYSK